jgi:hypothetical protein
MERVLERCCGLDVHKKTVAACVRIPGKRGRRQQEVRTFGTTARELLVLRDWLAANGVTHVAMESTGSTGSRSSMSWKARSAACSPTPHTSPRSLEGRRT